MDYDLGSDETPVGFSLQRNERVHRFTKSWPNLRGKFRLCKNSASNSKNRSCGAVIFLAVLFGLVSFRFSAVRRGGSQKRF
jgi:hypothetical protein